MILRGQKTIADGATRTELVVRTYLLSNEIMAPANFLAAFENSRQPGCKLRVVLECVIEIQDD